MSKCEFGQRKAHYLGHVISMKGVGVDSKKIDAMNKWSKPKKLMAMCGFFLGLTGHYRRFIQDCGKIATPLNQMLKKDNFTWTPAATIAFETLKHAMVQVPILALLDFSKEFVLECDASGVGTGVALHQGCPIAFLSQELQGNQLLLSIYENKILALVLAVQKWRPYLLGCHFLARYDQHSLKYLWSQNISTTTQQKRALQTHEFLLLYWI